MKKERVGRKEKITREIELPEDVSASINDQFLLIKGPKGDVKRKFKQRRISIKLENKKIILESKSETKKDKKLIGSLMSHVKNMIKGSLQNHVYTLKICSGHFPMNISVIGNKLAIKNFLGEKVPRILQLKEGVGVKVEGELIHVTSASKETAGQVSADIEQLTRRPGFDSRIFQDGIYLINKDGKELK
ncbi:50S ribosomal protein L6 [Candidatus Woesearchaeota archaeon]|nr:50S ribosomal protein L6 [Candidatus Woesearchaeota archaeon]